MTPLRVYFKHYQFDRDTFSKNQKEIDDFVEKAVNEAHQLGQIKQYRTYFHPNGTLHKVISNCKGISICFVENEQHEVVAKGFSFFVPPHPDEIPDVNQRQFNKNEGRRISMRRVKRELGLKGILKDAKLCYNWKELRK